MWMIGMGLRVVRRLRATPSERQTAPVAGARSSDWLPPVLGPEDWSIGLLADRSAGWYFDRR